MKKAFTMIELIFVIVILGILAAVAVPKLFVTREDAIITKGRADISAILSGITLYKNQKMLQGINEYPSSLGDCFENVAKVTCGGSYGFIKKSDNTYTFKLTNNKGADFTYNSSDGSFSCKADTANTSLCNLLEP